MKTKKEIEERIAHYKTLVYSRPMLKMTDAEINIRTRIVELEWVLEKNQKRNK